MRRRNNLLQLWLSDEEMQTLRNNSEQTGKTMSAYVRCVLDGFRPVATPPLDYFNLLREVRRVGYNIRQIAQRAYTLNMIDAPQYDENAKRILNLCDDLTMICLPRGDKH